MLTVHILDKAPPPYSKMENISFELHSLEQVVSRDVSAANSSNDPNASGIDDTNVTDGANGERPLGEASWKLQGRRSLFSAMTEVEGNEPTVSAVISRLRSMQLIAAFFDLLLDPFCTCSPDFIRALITVRILKPPFPLHHHLRFPLDGPDIFFL